jgi:hypothetical protein
MGATINSARIFVIALPPGCSAACTILEHSVSRKPV